MISYISGVILLKKETFLVVENQGIGYQVFVPTAVLESAKLKEEIALYTYDHIREDARILFGFPTYRDLELFELLLTVSGIGPKTGLTVFSKAGAKEIVSAIVNEDAAMLKKVPGIGSKTAERIVLELKNKVGDFGDLSVLISKQTVQDDEDAVMALTSLGYSVQQAREALKLVPSEVTDLGLKVREALKVLK